MNMKKFSSLIFLMLALTPLQIQAHAPKDGDVYVTLGPFAYTTPRFYHHFDAPTLVSPALIAEADLYHRGGLEVSMFYLRNAFSLLRDGRKITEQVKRIYITMGYRHWFSEDFSGALAFASSYTMGDTKVLQDDFPIGERPKTSARDITEYGLDLSFQQELLSTKRVSFVLDARFGFSLTPKISEQSNHFGIMLGLKYFLQSRQRVE